MSTATDTALANYALSKIGGTSGESYAISDITDTDSTSSLCEDLLAICRKEVLCRAYWNEATKFADLGDDIKDTQIDISSIAVGADPFPVTVTTDEAHGKATGDIVYLLDIEGTGGVEGLNGLKKTITVVDTTSFTLDDTIGTAVWSHTADTGVMSDAPESGDWEYAFSLPDDYLGRCQQVNESYHRSTKPRYLARYDKEIVQGFLFTNHLSNADDDSAYIVYVYDLDDSALFSRPLYEAIVVKMAAELSPVMLVDQGRRRVDLLKEYEQLVLPLAEGHNAMENSDDEDEGEFSAITCRTT